MKEVLTRIIFGLLFVAVVMASVWWHWLSALIVFWLAALIGISECLSMKIVNNRLLIRFAITAGGALVFLLSVWCFANSWFAFPLFGSAIGCLFALRQLIREHISGIMETSIISALYISLSLSFIPALAIIFGEELGPIFVTVYFIFLWVNDTMAFVFGRLFGKHKLWSRISPGKTVEGFAGGLLCTLAAAWGLSLLFNIEDFSFWILPAIMVSVLGTLGDLVESAMKRVAGVKDSGTIIPGHGGILDRFDGLFLSLPLFFVYLLMTHSNQ